ncbi:Uncharacterized protein conserved in bacteria (DUF2330) [Seminavis robusta]|uniref:Uncharacterized protein conserved in bacteria (DUF2330) n=1 Tax=Seminavis robusta TaxID=568900 RepID=A0A9N8EHV2_9STRA|nr:Uncharacterized protein conserved in bacteria (DUF2330) [Seminavis robusta]|eukprot:Sro1158_g247470.1 Uncharacterized protein conserved in bacteria (DUF2330) (633) ;mRNA; r:14813-16711
MMKWARCCIGLALVLPTGVRAVGGFFGAENDDGTLQTGQAMAFGVEGNDVTVVYQIRYGGGNNYGRNFSWVIPVPNRPTNVDVGSDVLFQQFLNVTKPIFELETISGESAVSLGDTIPCNSRVEYTTEWCDEGGAQEFVISSTTRNPLEPQTIGPYEYVILEPGQNADPTQVLRYLRINGYTQSRGSDALLNFYSKQGYAFIVLRLRGSNVGYIQPLIVTYPQNEEPEMGISISLRSPAATIPFQMASNSVKTDWNYQPIRVYALGSARAVPLNFLEVELDDAQADWLKTGQCFIKEAAHTISGVDDCHLLDYLDRFSEATMELANHSFVTEYAGTSSIMDNKLFINLTAEEIENTTSWEDFQDCCLPRLPETELVITTLTEFGVVFRSRCGSLCDRWGFDDDREWNATGLALELDERFFQPAIEAQAWVDKFPYLTAMFARLSTETLSKDAFFTFNSALPPVDNVHRATAFAPCGSNGTVIITVPDDGNPACGSELEVSLLLNAFQALNPDTSKAKRVTAWGFQWDPPIHVSRLQDGTFDFDEIATAISYGDSLVVDQTIPEYIAQEQELLEDAIDPLSSEVEDAVILKSNLNENDAKEDLARESTPVTSSASSPYFSAAVSVLAWLTLYM